MKNITQNIGSIIFNQNENTTILFEIIIIKNYY